MVEKSKSIRVVVVVVEVNISSSSLIPLVEGRRIDYIWEQNIGSMKLKCKYD